MPAHVSRRPLLSMLVVSTIAAPCPAQSTGPVGPAERVAHVADSLAAARLRGGVTGLVVGVYHAGRPIHVRAYGLADEAAGRAMTAAQPLDIASITKQFTAAAVLRLVDDGRIALDAPLSTYLADAGPTLGAITIRQLLNQLSGVGRYEPAFQDHAPRSRDEILRTVRDAPSEFAPGSRFAYNNANYFLLGRVVERAAGMPWDAYLAKAFFAPLGLRDTRACGGDRRGLASGYAVGQGGAHVVRAPLPVLLTDAAGGLCSTADDLARWTAALHGGRVLSPASYAAMTTPPVGGPDSRYAMGTVVESVAGHRKLWHNGALTSGFNAQLAHYPADSLTIVVLANAYPAQPEALETALFRAWAGIATPPVAAADGPALPLTEYAGTYAVGGLRFVVSVDSARNGLAMVDPNGRALPLRHVGGHVFALRGDDTFRVLFDVDGGHAVRLRIDSPRAKAPPAPRVP